MAHFIGYLKGHRGEASRLGTPKSGLSASAQGWNLGGRIEVRVNANGEDEVTIYLTAGCNGHTRSRVLGCFTATDLA